MIITFLLTIISFSITFFRSELGGILVFLGILFPFQAGRVTWDVGVTAGVFGAGLLSFLVRGRKFPFGLKLLCGCLIGFIILGLFSQLQAYKVLPAEIAHKSFISYKWFSYNFLVLFCIFFTLDSPTKLYRFMQFFKFVYTGVIILALLQILKYLNLLNIGEYKYFINEGMGEVYSIFDHGGPNVLIVFIFMAFPLIFSLNHNKGSKGKNIETFSLFALTLIVSIFTFARAAYLTIMICSLGLFLPVFFLRGKFLETVVLSFFFFPFLAYLLIFYGFKTFTPPLGKNLPISDNFEVYLINPNHKIKQIIQLSPEVKQGKLLLNLSGGTGKDYQLSLKIGDQIAHRFTNSLEIDHKWYEIEVPESYLEDKQELDVVLEVKGKTDAKNNYVVVYGGKNTGEEKVKSYFYDGLKWNSQDLSPQSGVQNGVYYIFFKPGDETKSLISESYNRRRTFWNCSITDKRYQTKQTISLPQDKFERDLYLELAGGAGKDYGIKIKVDGELVKEYGPLEEPSRWYKLTLPERLLKDKNKIDVILEGSGEIDPKDNWFLVKGGSWGQRSHSVSSFFDGISWQNYDLSPDKGVQKGTYNIFLGLREKQHFKSKEKNVWSCGITDKRYQVKQIIPLPEGDGGRKLYLELAGATGKDYEVNVKVEGRLVRKFGPLEKTSRWYKIELPEALIKDKEGVEVIVEGSGQIDSHSNWFLVKGSSGNGNYRTTSSFFDGVSWQNYDLSPDEGIQIGTYHIFMEPSATDLSGNQTLYPSGWDTYLASEQHKVLQKIFIPPTKQNGKIFLMLSGGMGKAYGLKILINGKLIKQFDQGLEVHPKWYAIDIPVEFLGRGENLDVELIAFGKLDQKENWVKIYGTNTPPNKNIKSFMWDGNKWIDFDLSLREGIQAGAYHIYYQDTPLPYSRYAIPIRLELFHNASKIKQTFFLDNDSVHLCRYVAINLGGGPGQDYIILIKANDQLLKEIEGGLPKPESLNWYKFELPKTLRSIGNKLDITMEIKKDDRKDIIQNRAFVAGGLPYAGSDIKSYADISGQYEEIGLPPIPGLSKHIYQIILLDQTGHKTFPPGLSLDNFSGKFLNLDELNLFKSPRGFMRNLLFDLTTYFVEKDQASHDRLLMWSLCFDIIKEHPLIGRGYYIFDKIYPAYYRKYSDLFPQIYTHPHNDYLAMGISFGVGGMILFVLWYIVPLKTSLKLISDSSIGPSNYGVPLAFIYFSLSVLSLFYMNFADQRLYGTFWIVVGITYVLSLSTRPFPSSKKNIGY